MSEEKKTCSYISPSGLHCHEQAQGQLCFWHDSNQSKDGIDLSQKLEDYAKSGGLMHGLQLRRADLTGVNLVNPKEPYFYDLSYSDLYRCEMRGAHLFNLKINQGSLMKANLDHANLHCANVENTNLLGIRLKGARIDNLFVGEELQQEKQAKILSNGEAKCIDYYEQAEEIYRTLRNASEMQGIFQFTGHFMHKEMTMRRFQMPLFSSARFSSKVVDLFCGYGEKPLHIISFSLMLILICAFAYYFLGIQYDDQLIRFSADQSTSLNIRSFFASLYFSVVTFTTLGYGDLTPVGFSRIVAAIEAFSGSFTIAMFVVVFVKRMTR